MLDQVGPLLLDDGGPDLEGLVVGSVELLHGGLVRLRLDAGLGRVVDTTGQVAVGVGHLGWGQSVGDGEQVVCDTHERDSFASVEDEGHLVQIGACCYFRSPYPGSWAAEPGGRRGVLAAPAGPPAPAAGRRPPAS